MVRGAEALDVTIELMPSNTNDGLSGQELAAELLRRTPAPPFDEYRHAGEAWPTDPNDAESNTEWARSQGWKVDR